MTPNEILYAAIDKYGKQAQMIMVLEEMSELQKEICKNFRGRDNVEQIADEIADVEITLSQLKLIFDISKAVRDRHCFKLRRLEQRLREGEE